MDENYFAYQRTYLESLRYLSVLSIWRAAKAIKVRLGWYCDNSIEMSTIVTCSIFDQKDLSTKHDLE